MSTTTQYVVCSSYLVSSKVKGELPDVVYEYIANSSSINWHYDFTRDVKEAYIFDSFEMDKVNEIAWLLNMNVKGIL